jgi:hypothetical protein
MLTNGWWCFRGTSLPASQNDIGLVNADFERLQKLLEKDDLILTDKMFRSLRDKLKIITGHSKPRNKEIEDWRAAENQLISSARGINERRIGDVKKRFKVTSKRFRSTTDSVPFILDSVLALDNIVNFQDIFKMNFCGGVELGEYLKDYKHFLNYELNVDIRSEKRKSLEEEIMNEESSVWNELNKVKFSK